MFMISDIFFKGYSVYVFLDSGYVSSFKISKKCLKYFKCVKKKLVGIHIFDQVTIDSILKKDVFDKNVCLELSIIFLKCASMYEGVELFQYINSEYYLPYIVVNVNGFNVVCNDYCYINSFLKYLSMCSWNVDISDIDLISSKYNLSFFDNNEYIDINDFYTISDILDKIDLFDCSMIGGGDIVFDLAVSLGIKYVLIDKNSNIDRFFDIVNMIDEY